MAPAAIGRNAAKVVALQGGRIGTSGFEAGQHGRRLRAIPTSSLAINSTIRAYGRNAIARSRYLCVNNPTAATAKEEFIAAFVGDGIKPSFVNDNPDIKAELQDVWLEWTDESDADGLTDFYGQQGIVAAEMFEAGECFVRLRSRFASDGLSVPLQLQLLPSEMCPFEYNMTLGNGRRIECGIQFDAIGRREGYWFYKNHPGELQFNNISEWLYFIPADQILHLFKPIRAGQIRGVPHTLAGIVTLALLDLYDDAELERKRTAALFSAFITRTANEEAEISPLGGAPTRTHHPGGNETGQADVGMEPGATVELDAGQTVVFSDPADVGGNYEAFQYRNYLRAAAGMGGTPYAQATGDLKGTSYGSQRGGMITFKRRVAMMQNSIMIFQFCRPIKQAWLKAAVLAGVFETFKPSDYLAKPKTYGKVRWIPPKWEWIDPLKDLSAEKLAVDSGFKPRSDVIEAMGFDAEEVDEQMAKDQNRAERLGLKFITTRSGIVLSPTSEEKAVESLTGVPDSTTPQDNPDSLVGPSGKPAKKPKPIPPQPAQSRRPAKPSWDDL